MMTDLPWHWSQNGGAFRSLKFGNLTLYEPGCISINPKTPCSPGPAPVMIDDQATQEISGIVERIDVRNPSWIIRSVLGITPLLAKSLSMPNGTPSRPMITSRAGFILFRGRGTGDYAARADILITDENKASQFLNIVEVLDGYRLFGLEDYFRNLKILDYLSVFLDNFER